MANPEDIKKAREESKQLEAREAAYNAALQKASKTLDDWKILVKKNLTFDLCDELQAFLDENPEHNELFSSTLEKCSSLSSPT
ncbi:MAG: hypothetical protein HC866_00750 [Leptolyngbyaceae cyanobacterium RU_5_1]|nr:hypothetical protein [Leptolyngbyaceae cyanobacterium RU_5_1]